MKILADENIPRSVVKFLKDKGHDIVALYEIGKSGISNSGVVELAKNENRTILTLDLDFGYTYYFASEKTVDVIVVRTKVPTPENVKNLLSKFLAEHAEAKGLVIISEKKVRIL